MKRLAQAPNLAIATLWADILNGAGLGVTVQRAFAGSIAGEIPPDQALPELWLILLVSFSSYFSLVLISLCSGAGRCKSRTID